MTWSMERAVWGLFNKLSVLEEITRPPKNLLYGIGADQLAKREEDEEVWESSAVASRDEPADSGEEGPPVSSSSHSHLFEMRAADRRVTEILDFLDKPAAADPRPAAVSPGAVCDPHVSPAPGRPQSDDVTEADLWTAAHYIEAWASTNAGNNYTQERLEQLAGRLRDASRARRK
jgi:hypothetical protein